MKVSDIETLKEKMKIGDRVKVKCNILGNSNVETHAKICTVIVTKKYRYIFYGKIQNDKEHCFCYSDIIRE